MLPLKYGNINETTGPVQDIILTFYRSTEDEEIHPYAAARNIGPVIKKC